MRGDTPVQQRLTGAGTAKEQYSSGGAFFFSLSCIMSHQSVTNYGSPSKPKLIERKILIQFYSAFLQKTISRMLEMSGGEGA